MRQENECNTSELTKLIPEKRFTSCVALDVNLR